MTLHVERLTKSPRLYRTPLPKIVKDTDAITALIERKFTRESGIVYVCSHQPYVWESLERWNNVEALLVTTTPLPPEPAETSTLEYRALLNPVPFPFVLTLEDFIFCPSAEGATFAEPGESVADSFPSGLNKALDDIEALVGRMKAGEKLDRPLEMVALASQIAEKSTESTDEDIERWAARLIADIENAHD
jgi:hypothetical protein